ncbi:MAG: adenylate/guanylate cyclase domain-containing protein, partial [Acidobacteriota bacterium]
REVHIVLPLPPDEFRKVSVDIIPNTDWGERFQRVLAQATRVIVTSEYHTDTNQIALHYANLIQDGLAILRARVLDTEPVALAVWDRQAGDGPGGTAALVKYWRAQGRETTIIDTTQLSAKIDQTASSINGASECREIVHQATTSTHFPQKIMAMLFADVVGYSRLKEPEIPCFVEHFMGTVAELLQSFPQPPVVKNTWGDALYFVFRKVEDAGLFALDLCDRLSNTDWTKKGLPKDLSIRIGLHAGPVFACREPILGKRNYTGTHVSWAARIEPITPPGQVYASQPFAALAAAHGFIRFACDYVGQIPLAKGYGTFPLYHVRRISNTNKEKSVISIEPDDLL